MLWSLVKVLIFVAFVAAITLGAGYLMEIDGGMQIQAMGVEISLSPLQTVLGFVILILAVWLMLKVLGLLVAVLRFINGDETAISRYFNKNRERKGFQALSDGMLALASGDGRQAMAKAAKAEKFLQKPELTNLIAAQAAEMTGDRRKAEEVYKRMLTDDRTRFVGVHGILQQKLAAGETDTALKLAEKAFALKPKHEATQDTLLKLQAGEEDWTGARTTLNAKLKHGSLPRDVHRRRDAVLALSEARDLRLAGKVEEAREMAIEANRLSPQLVPAANMASHAYVEQGKPRLATKVIRAAWEQAPHPELAANYAAIAPDETPQARMKRFKTLIKSNLSDPEAKMLMAELHIAAEDFPAARMALGDLAQTDPTVRSLTIMAAIERGEGADDQVVRGFLTRALGAQRDPQWICDVCGEAHSAWQPVCTGCGAMDSLSWKRPSNAEVQSQGSVQMLPLIVGAIESAEEAETIAEPVAEGEILALDGETTADEAKT